jgi:hypothetical protein
MIKRSKKAELKKLSIDVTTIRILTEAEEQKVIGGAGLIRTSGTCSNEPQTCP